MAIVNSNLGTRIDEIADGIYRISIPVAPSAVSGGFSYNQFLILDENPMLFHTGSRSLFPFVKEAIASVMPVEKLRYIGFSHYEQDECGSLNLFLEMAPQAQPACGRINAMINRDGMDRPPMVLGDGQELLLGKRRLRWFDAPHLPHGWECGYMMEEKSRTLLCGDLFTQGGHQNPPLVESDILGPSEEMRKKFDYFSHAKNAGQMLERLASTSPTTLACMHGSAWRGDGSKLLLKLAHSLDEN